MSDRVSIKIQGKSLDQVLMGLKAAVKKLPTQIAITAETFFKKNFDLEGFQGDSGLEHWKKRNPYALRNTRKVLMDRGNLKRGIKKTVIGNSIMIKVVGVAEKYADIHNSGGTITQRPTAKQRGYFLMRSKNAASKAEKEYWLNMSRAKVLKIEMPKRKYIGKSRQLNKKFHELIIEQLNKAVK